MNAPLQTDTIANTVAGRLDLIRANESLRAQLANCQARRLDLERRLLIAVAERDEALTKLEEARATGIQERPHL